MIYIKQTVGEKIDWLYKLHVMELLVHHNGAAFN